MRRGQMTSLIKECASNGLQDQPKGRRRVDAIPEGVTREKDPETEVGREIDQKQFERSSLVNMGGGPTRGVERDSR